MAIQSAIVQHDISWLVRKYTSGCLNTNISIQRREVWDIDVKSNLIVSYLCGVPVEDLFFEEDGVNDEGEEIYKVIDGKNRAITTAQYMNNEFALSKNILRTKLFDESFGIPINEIIGKHFSELPDRLQNVMKERQIPFTIARPMTETERATVYFMRNQTVPLTDMELMIPIVGEDIMGLLTKLSEHNFMIKKTKITAPARRKKGDIRVILEYFMLTRRKGIGLTKLEFKTFCDEINDSAGMINSNEVLSIINYLDSAFKKKEPYLNRANLPIIFIVAKQAIDKKIEIDKFYDWADACFNELKDDEEYKVKTKSYKSNDVQSRLKIITDNARENLM